MKKKKMLSILPMLFLSFLSCQNSSLEPENQFVQIYFKYEFKNELNTFENTYQKDLFLDGVIKIEFWLTAEEQRSVLRKTEELNYFTLPDTLKYIPQDSVAVSINPNPGEQILRIKYNSKDKITVWFYPLNEDNAQVKQVMELNSFIISLIESKPEYKKLPPKKGGYD